MSLVPSWPPFTDPIPPARYAAGHSLQVRHWRDRAILSLAFVVLIAGFVLYRAAPLRSVTRMRSASNWTIEDRGLRQLAVNAPPPAYPSTSLANNITGVVVATVTVGAQGKVRSVTIVDCPDAATGRAVRDAVWQWVFRPLGVSSPVGLITGNIIFYFHRLDGRGVVSSSEELQTSRGLTSALGHLDAQAVVRVIDETEYRRLRNSRAPVVLDIRSRAAHLPGNRDGAVSIPLSELSTRAGAELPVSRLIVIDCFAEQRHSGVCGMASHILASSGFSSVAILNRSRE